MQNVRHSNVFSNFFHEIPNVLSEGMVVFTLIFISSSFQSDWINKPVCSIRKMTVHATKSMKLKLMKIVKEEKDPPKQNATPNYEDLQKQITVLEKEINAKEQKTSRFSLNQMITYGFRGRQYSGKITNIDLRIQKFTVFVNGKARVISMNSVK